jgi:hypothetical protein
MTPQVSHGGECLHARLAGHGAWVTTHAHAPRSHACVGQGSAPALHLADVTPPHATFRLAARALQVCTPPAKRLSVPFSTCGVQSCGLWPVGRGGPRATCRVSACRNAARLPSHPSAPKPPPPFLGPRAATPSPRRARRLTSREPNPSHSGALSPSHRGVSLYSVRCVKQRVKLKARIRVIPLC